MKSEFQQYVSEFDFFLTECDQNIEEARAVLESLDCTQKDIDYYLQKFQTGARRLKIDIRQEYERKMLQLRHSIENEALDNQTTLSFQLPSHALSPSVVIENLTFFEGQGNTQQIIYGSYDYNENDKILMAYIEKLASNQEELETELKILKDKKASVSEKTTAFEKLKRFLSDNAVEIGSVAFKLIKGYLEMQL